MLLCKSKHVSTWFSQPTKNNIFLGNLLLASSIVFSGGTFKPFHDMVDIMRLQVISKSTFYWFQNKYIFGTINKVYKLYQDRILSHVDKNSVRLGGDGRHDSPGHNAKYCTYSVMEQTSSEILHFHVTHVAETDGNSNLMEKTGPNQST